MGQNRRPGLTSAQKTELWDRWQRGESLKAIGRAFGKPSSSIYCLVSPHGGIRPEERRRSRLALTLSERDHWELLNSPPADDLKHIFYGCAGRAPYLWPCGAVVS